MLRCTDDENDSQSNHAGLEFFRSENCFNPVHHGTTLNMQFESYSVHQNGSSGSWCRTMDQLCSSHLTSLQQVHGLVGKFLSVKQLQTQIQTQTQTQTQAQYLLTFEHAVLQMGSGGFVRAFI